MARAGVQSKAREVGVDRRREHPLRTRVLAELHARPFSALNTPSRVLHYAFMTDAAAAEADQAALSSWLAARGASPPRVEARHHRAPELQPALRWERHSEFTTYSWEYSDAAAEGTPFAAARPVPPTLEDRDLARESLLVAVDLHLVAAAEVPPELQAAFAGPDFAVSEAAGGAALIATDFRPDADGYVRILVIDRDLTPDQAGPLVQRLLEIETYRTLTLLGLPEAQSRADELRAAEMELPRLIEQMGGSDSLSDNKALLDRLSALSAELEASSAALAFRLSATRAYHELVRLRLDAIAERPWRGESTWAAFLSRRLNPAVRTCTAFEERQGGLSRKLARAAQLLRTRVEIDLESQNQDLLRAMNARVRLQLQLQHAVEGLSVAAITYYAAGLCHMVLQGAQRLWPKLDAELATAAVAPLLFVAIALTVRRVRRSHADPAS
jgi:uncharacterized membrane-anchored protein